MGWILMRCPDHFDRKEARKLDRFAQYALVASDEAIADANFAEDRLDKFRVGVIWGAGIGGLETFQDEMISYGEGDHTTGHHIALEHFGIATQRSNALLNTGTARVVKTNHRRTHFHGLIH